MRQLTLGGGRVSTVFPVGPLCGVPPHHHPWSPGRRTYGWDMRQHLRPAVSVAQSPHPGRVRSPQGCGASHGPPEPAPPKGALTPPAPLKTQRRRCWEGALTLEQIGKQGASPASGPQGWQGGCLWSCDGCCKVRKAQYHFLIFGKSQFSRCGGAAHGSESPACSAELGQEVGDGGSTPGSHRRQLRWGLQDTGSPLPLR